jgi:hypothetical protein
LGETERVAEGHHGVLVAQSDLHLGVDGLPQPSFALDLAVAVVAAAVAVAAAAAATRRSKSRGGRVRDGRPERFGGGWGGRTLVRGDGWKRGWAAAAAAAASWWW